MKILYISHKVPYPLSDGGKLRVFNHIKHLFKSHEITSLSFISNKKELENINELRKYCSVEAILLPNWKSLLNSFLGLFSKKPLRVWYLKDKEFKKKAKKLSREADLIIIQAPRMAQYGFYPKKTIIDIVDTPSLQIRRALKHESFIWKKIWNLELPRMEKWEKDIGWKFENIIFASKADRAVIGKGKILKNGTFISKVERKQVFENNIMFLGAMDYQPNIDAIQYFIEKIFPLVREKVPDAKFYIVGKNEDKVRKYANKDIVVTGFVDDLSVYFAKCKVFAAPLRLGSGIQNKVLEALNYGIPVVTTSIVNEGVEAKDREEIIVADNTKEFANKVVMLLKEKRLRDGLSLNGKKFLEENYSWEMIYGELDRIIKEIAL